MGRRTVLLVVAVLIAALGAGLVLIYVHDVNQKVKAREAPEQILIAKKIIQPGRRGLPRLPKAIFEFSKVAKEAVAAGALATIDQVANLVALAPIYPGEQILRQKFGKQNASSALTIPTAGTVALSISLPGPAGVNGFVAPGSQVAVFLTAGGSTKLILPRVSVIAVGSRTLVPSSGQATGTIQQSDVVTFGVTAAQAQTLIFAQSAGSLYLTLLTANSSVPSLPPTSATNVTNAAQS